MPNPANMSFVPATDPTGHSQPCVEAVYTDPDTGAVTHPGHFYYQHAGQLLRFFEGSPSPSNTAGTVFELEATPTTLTLAAGRVVIQAG